MMIDVSIATAYSEVYFDYFQSFFRFSFFVCKKKIIFYFCVFVLTNYVCKNKIIYFLVTSLSAVLTAGLGFKMAASNSKWQVCDVIVTSRHVIIFTS